MYIDFCYHIIYCHFCILTSVTISLHERLFRGIFQTVAYKFWKSDTFGSLTIVNDAYHGIYQTTPSMHHAHVECACVYLLAIYACNTWMHALHAMLHRCSLFGHFVNYAIVLGFRFHMKSENSYESKTSMNMNMNLIIFTKNVFLLEVSLWCMVQSVRLLQMSDSLLNFEKKNQIRKWLENE